MTLRTLWSFPSHCSWLNIWDVHCHYWTLSIGSVIIVCELLHTDGPLEQTLLKGGVINSKGYVIVNHLWLAGWGYFHLTAMARD